MMLLLVTLEDEYEFSSWEISSSGEFFRLDEWKVPVDVVRHSKMIEILGVYKPSLSSKEREIKTLAGYKIPFSALSKKSKKKVQHTWPEMFI